MTRNTLNFLSAEDVTNLLPMADAIDAMRDAFGEISTGKARIPLRTHIDLPEKNAGALFMPGYLSGRNILGIKMVTLFADNPLKNLPLIHAIMVLMDGQTGKPLAVLDGERLTAIRTGAASGLATDLLARQNAEVLTVFGAGIQGRTQIEAVAAVRTLKQVYIIDTDPAKTSQLIAELSSIYPFPIVKSDPERAVSTSDIICTATTSAQPLFEPAHISPGTHINAIGAYKPDKREIPGSTVARALVIVDERRACLTEAGDLVLAQHEGYINEKHIAAELGEVILGQHPGRRSEDQITLFKSVGNAAQDIAAAARIIKKLNNGER